MEISTWTARAVSPPSPITIISFDSFHAFVAFTFLAGACMGLLISKCMAFFCGGERPQPVGHMSSTQGPSPHSATDATPEKQDCNTPEKQDCNDPEKQDCNVPPASANQRPKKPEKKFEKEGLKQCIYITSEYSKVYHTRGTCHSIKNFSALRHLRICEFCHHDD